MTGGYRQGLKYLGSKKSFWGGIRGIFHPFWGTFSCQGFLGPGGVPLAWDGPLRAVGDLAGCWGSCGLCLRSRARRACTLLVEVYPAGKLQ